MLTDVHLPLRVSDRVWNPSLVPRQKSTHCYSGAVTFFYDASVVPFSSDKSPFFTSQGSPILSGNCWCFVGLEGTLAVSLSHPVKITHVTVDHLPRYNSPSGDIKSAPKDFEVHVSETPC